MPADMSKYPPDWKEFSKRIRFTVAEGRCQCTGQCGLHSTNPGPRRCTERHGEQACYAKGQVILTVAHLCDCDPPCVIPEHVIACCQRCHLRIDIELHMKRSRETRHRKRREASIQAGQKEMAFS